MKAVDTLKEELAEKKANLIDTVARREEEETDEHEDMSVDHSETADVLNHWAEIKSACDWVIRSFTDGHSARK